MFQNISKIENSKERKSFIEKVNLFVRFISVFAEKHNLLVNSVNSKISNNTIQRLIELNIMQSGSEDEQTKLLKVLKTPLYKEFITSINFNLKYHKEIGNLLDNLDTSKRKIIQENNKNNNSLRMIDFFCGAGGLSLGFKQEGFEIDLANDYEEVCIDTYKYNHPEIPDDRIILGDIRNLVEHISDYLNNEIDIVVGGPPCQGFSTANQQRLIDDPRNELYKYFLKAISYIAPKFVVMENVKGMLPYSDQVIEDYKNLNIKRGDKEYSYNVECKVLVSNDFGVAQKRQRLFFIAIRNDIATELNIKPYDIFNEIEQNNTDNKEHVLKDALSFIKPLDSPRIKNMTEIDDEVTGKKIDINHYKGDENTYLKLINNNREIEYVYNHKARYANDINYEIYGTLEQGEDGTSESIKHIMPYKHRNHIFKDKYFKLVSDKPSRTITAHMKMDCHSHIHPTQTRSLTPREAARVQSFPDDYFFLGAYLKTYMQIGNAVPPVMARGIAKAIKKYL